jgi:pyruvate kinase
MGKYPVQAVEMMARIAQVTEKRLRALFAGARDVKATIADTIGNAACEIAARLNARLIIAMTSSGYTARMIARHRPPTPICAITLSERAQRRLALIWGIHGALLSRAGNMEAVIEESLRGVLQQGLAQKGDLVVITGGVPAGISGKTNMIQVRVVTGEG